MRKKTNARKTATNTGKKAQTLPKTPNTHKKKPKTLKMHRTPKHLGKACDWKIQIYHMYSIDVHSNRPKNITT